MTEPTFDPKRSAAIRAVLIDTVDQTPVRDRRRHLRYVVLTVLAALGIGLGSTAVAVAVGGIDLFPPASTEAAPAPATTPSTPAASPTPVASNTPVPHPLVVTGDPIAPRDVLTAPPENPSWSLDLPAAGDPCEPLQVIDVADGYALVQSGPTSIPQDAPADCEPSSARLSLSLIDTRDGRLVWTRDWSWPLDPMSPVSSETMLLGTSGAVIVQTTVNGLVDGESPLDVPNEVLDLATGTTRAPLPERGAPRTARLRPVGDDSGDVIATRQVVDSSGAVMEMIVDREDPLNPSPPLWSVTVEASSADLDSVANDSSIVPIHYLDSTGQRMLKVVDVDTGATMVEGLEDRSYEYLDGVTLRHSASGPEGRVASVAGIDDAGNEIWSRDDPDHLTASGVFTSSVTPGSRYLPSSDVIISYSDKRLELVDGLSGDTRWIIDGTLCGDAPAGGFHRAADGIVIGAYEDTLFCGVADDGSVIDVGGRPVPSPSAYSPLGTAATYDLYRGWGTGGLFTYRFEPRDPDEPAQATVRDAITGETLWTRPIASDERWTFAGGYLVGISAGTMYSIG